MSINHGENQIKFCSKKKNEKRKLSFFIIGKNRDVGWLHVMILTSSVQLDTRPEPYPLVLGQFDMA